MVDTSALIRFALVTVVFITALLLAAGLNVDPKRRSLPGWLAWGILLVSFSPILLEEVGVIPWGENGIVVAVIATFTLYVSLPLIFTSVLTSESRIEDVADPALVGRHYQPVTDEYDPGVYRVVGDNDAVTLLYVADAAGDRVHTGTTTQVDATAFDSRFDPAADPDAGFHPVRTLQNQFTGLYWNVRKFL